MAGAFRARVAIDLEPVNEATSIRYSMDLTLLGRLASLGEAIVRSTSKQLSRQFADNLAELFKHAS
jgi:carbon monoxide dehydrogenase subunit G